MKENSESDRAFLRNLHAKYYNKKKRRIKKKEEESKQMWLFEDEQGRRYVR